MPEREVAPEDYDRIEELIDFEQVGRAIGAPSPSCPRSSARPHPPRDRGRSYREVARRSASPRRRLALA